MPKLLIIILGGFILLVAGGVTVMQQMGLGPFAKQKVLTPEQLATIPPTYVSLEPILIPIFRGQIIAATLKLDVKIATKANGDEIIKKQIPRLTDAYVRDLHAYVPRVLRKKKKLELDMVSLGKRMKIISERTIGKGIVLAVSVSPGLKN